MNNRKTRSSFFIISRGDTCTDGRKYGSICLIYRAGLLVRETEEDSCVVGVMYVFVICGLKMLKKARV